VYKGKIAAATDRWAIDGTVLQWQDKMYFIWSGWAGTTDGQQNLYIAEMSNPWTITGDRVLLSLPTLSWERHGLPINEGPQILIEDGQLHIIYSASGYWTPQYALGRLTYKGIGPVMSASSWAKTPTPVFQPTSEIVGVGHASFTTSPDGTEDWIVYHAHPSPGGDANARVVRIQEYSFTNGTPNFGAPLSPGVIEVPSGFPDPSRPIVLGDFDVSGAVNAADLNVWKATYGTERFPGSFRDGHDFLNWQRQLGATATAAASANALSSAAATAELAVGGDEAAMSGQDFAALAGFAALNETPDDASAFSPAQGDVSLLEQVFDQALSGWAPATVLASTNDSSTDGSLAFEHFTKRTAAASEIEAESLAEYSLVSDEVLDAAFSLAGTR
jgi:hypothetical protein